MAIVCTEKSKSQVKISVIRAAAAPPTTVGAWSMAVVLWQQYIINPRRASAERVTVVVLCVCVCMYVCHAHAILAVRAIKSVTKDTVVLNVRFAAIL